MCTSPVNGEWACLFVLRVSILHPSMILRVDIETFPSVVFLFYFFILLYGLICIFRKLFLQSKIHALVESANIFGSQKGLYYSLFLS